MQAPDAIDYAVATTSQWFTAQVGLAPDTPFGSVRFEVLGQADPRRPWRQLVATEFLDDTRGFVRLRCRLAGLNALRLRAVPGDRGFVQARGWWIEPRIIE